MPLSEQLTTSAPNPLSLLGSHETNDDNVTITESQLQSTADSTPMALLEQLIYVENNFGGSVGNFENDLSIFADESFIFPDEDKPSKYSNRDDDDDGRGSDDRHHEGNSNNLFQQFSDIQSARSAGKLKEDVESSKSDEKDLVSESLIALLSSQSSNGTNPMINKIAKSLLANLPKCKVPNGAKISLSAAGLSDIQVDALAALIYQQQKLKSTKDEFTSDEFFISYLNNNNNQFAGDTLLDHSKLNGDFHFGTPGEFTTTTTHTNTIEQHQLESIDPLSNHHEHQRAFSLDSSVSSSLNQNQSPGSDLSPMYNEEGENGKKRRNTAASARFRIKKRIREQEMEKSIKNLNDSARDMQMRIKELEIENKLLRNLIIGKGHDGL